LRKSRSPNDTIAIVGNFTPVPRYNYQIGVPQGGFWEEVLNSDAPLYGGSGQGNLGGVESVPVPCHGRDYMLTVTVPPLGMVAFKHRA
jgi:1,4-alpha-glucan branching enzyme